jgi:ankyrin repeat protein
MPMKRLHVLWIGVVFSAAVFGATSDAAPDIRLLDAVAKHDHATVRTLLNQHVDVNAAQADGTTALHVAARQGDVETARLLIRAGANAKAMNRYGVTPLTEAAANSPGPITEMLLRAGADPNSTIGEGETVLMTAAHAGNADAAKALIAAGADVNAREKYRGQTALMWAAGEGHVEVVKLLAETGADLNAHSFRREDPLKVGERIPISHGGLTALLLAARQGEAGCVRALLAAGNDINQADEDGNTALILAIINSHYDLAGFLFEKGENPNLADKDGRTPLYAAVDMHSQEISVRPSRKETDMLTSLDMIQAALSHGANPNAQLKGHVGAKAYLDGGDTTLAAGATSFMRAARGADVGVMRLLVEKDANPKLSMNDKTNALMIAAGIGYREGRTRGTDREAIEAIKLCVELGLDLNAISDKGETAMHGAAHRGADEIVQFLFEKGARLDVKDKQGFTPLDRALGKGAVAGGGTRNPHASTVTLIEKLMQDKGTRATAQVQHE